MKREYALLYFLSAVLILTGSFLLPWVEKAEYERGKRDGIAECEKNCKAEAHTPDLDCVTRGKEKMCIQHGNGSISLVPAPVIAREVSKPIRKPAPKPKPCDPCEGIKGLREEMDRRFSSLEDAMRSKAEPDTVTTGAFMVDKDGNLMLVPGVPHPTFDNSAIGGPCITCSITPATPCGGLPCATMSTPPYHDLEGTTINGTSEPTKYVAPASNGPGAFMFYTPPHGAPTTATPEPRTLLLAAGGLGFIAWRMNR